MSEKQKVHSLTGRITDQVMHEAGYDFVRYADDFVVICSSRKQADEARSFVRDTIDELGLTLKPRKRR